MTHTTLVRPGRARRIACGSLAYVLAACAVQVEPSPRAPDVDVPAAWSARPAPDPADTAPPLDWWTMFGDDALDLLVQRALAHNHDLRAVAARLDAAVARAEIAGAELWPWLNGRFDASRARRNFIGFPIPGSGDDVLSTTTDARAVGLELSWELDLWGRIRAGELAASTDVEAAAADLLGARLSIAALTAKTWFAALEADQQLRLAEQTAANYTSSAERIRRRFEAGTRSPLDLRLALVELASARALVERRRQESEFVLRDLQVLLGRYPDTARDAGAELPTLLADVPAGLPSELLRRRPDLVAAERRLASADARLAEARASLYPRISLTASGGTSSEELHDLSDWDFRVWSWAANIFVPLFEGGRLRAGIRLRDAERREVLADYGGTILNAFREVETALANERLLAQEETWRRDAAVQAEAARRLSEDRYNRGLEDVITLLAAQRRDLETKSAFLFVRRQRLDTRVDLMRALGGGYEAPAPTAEPPPP